MALGINCDYSVCLDINPLDAPDGHKYRVTVYYSDDNVTFLAAGSVTGCNQTALVRNAQRYAANWIRDARNNRKEQEEKGLRHEQSGKRLPTPVPNPKPRRLPVLPVRKFRQPANRFHGGYECWSLSVEEKKNYDRLSWTNRVELILCDGNEVRYTVEYDPSKLEEMGHPEKFYLLRVRRAKEAQCN